MSNSFFVKPLFFTAQASIVLLAFFVALFFAWHTLSWVNFLYPLLYDTLDFASVIEQYAPLNIHKTGFEQTERAQHIALFGEIVAAINHGGQGLANMVYYDLQGKVVDTVFTPSRSHSPARRGQFIRRINPSGLLGDGVVGVAGCFF